MAAILPWQTPIWQRLLQQAQRNRLGHAYLLSGLSGVGKKSFCLAVAQRFLCLQAPHEAPCGQCQSCTLNKAHTHPDLHILGEDTLNQEGRAIATISIDSIRSLIHFATQSAQLAPFRIAVIVRAENMNPNASNALLKVLEEPINTLLLLTSDTPNRLLPTIRSRCQTLRLEPTTRQCYLNWLKEELPNTPEHKLQEALTVSRERPLLAAHFIKQDQPSVQEDLFPALVHITKGNHTPSEMAQRLQAHDVSGLIQWIVFWVQQMIRYHLERDDSIFLYTHRPLLGYIADKTSSKHLFDFYDWLIALGRTQISNKNLNPLLITTELLIRWLHLTL